MPKRLVLALLLAAYAALMVKVIVFKDIAFQLGHMRIKLAQTGPGPPNFMPFKSIAPYLRGDHGLGIAVFDLGGNVALLVPIGFLAPLVYRRMTWPIALALALAVPLALESMEVAFAVGIFDVDDILLNGLGVLFGYGVFRIVAKLGAARRQRAT